VFDLIIDKNLSAFRNLCGDDKDDIRQWAHIRLWQGLDKLKPNMLQGALQYFWTICRNHIYTRAGRAAAHIMDDIDLISEHNLPDSQMTADKNITQQDLRIQIMMELDKKTAQFKTVTISYVYLTKLKQYLLDNEYDASGFDKYICNELNLTDDSYRVINSRLKLKARIFKSNQ
jgi:DNA-directed RNA polymerase specialized sigma24 family protein